MIIVRIKGGLGNQLFQYALARSISIRHRIPFKLDVHSGFMQDHRGRKYGLCHFNIIENVASSSECDRIYPGRGMKQKWFHLIQRRGVPFSRRILVEERVRHFDPAVLRRSYDRHVVLDGFWQTEKYFSHIRQVLQKELTIKYNITGLNRDILKEIRSTESVCIHVRRGDNANKPDSIIKYGTPGLSYYIHAIEFMASRIRNPRFFIFSDDPNWTEKNIKPSYRHHYIIHNGDDKNFEDFRLMQNCKHFIISNSTFGWWPAWLGSDPGKIVVAPDPWYRNPSFFNRDLIPDRWHQMES